MRKLREEAGLTQSGLGDLLGYRREEIVRFETDARQIPLPVRIILQHVPLAKLIGKK